jgi:hypothetical protein
MSFRTVLLSTHVHWACFRSVAAALAGFMYLCQLPDDVTPLPTILSGGSRLDAHVTGCIRGAHGQPNAYQSPAAVLPFCLPSSCSPFPSPAPVLLTRPAPAHLRSHTLSLQSSPPLTMRCSLAWAKLTSLTGIRCALVISPAQPIWPEETVGWWTWRSSAA